MRKSYRIISIEAADIYKHEQKNGVAVGCKFPEKNSDAYFCLFKIYLDYSLDLIEIEKAYKRICRKKFSFQDKYGNDYTLAVINVKFNYTYKVENGKPVKIKQLREYFYVNGFNVNGVHYVRYKRSAGSSREGTCLFIDERLYKYMTKWSECGLKPNNDLASWESYKALSLSFVKGTVEISLNGILFVPDYKSTFIEEVVLVELNDGKLVAEQKKTEITNDIWDGESLLDESIFAGSYADKHMLLLRNKFFKSCGFRTKLQKWIKDKNISLDDLKARGFVTLATDVNQIVMVTTPNSLKYFKFAGGLSEKNIRKWVESVSDTFGVVKWDKSTRFFHGKMVQSSYQLLNTLGLSEAQTAELLEPSIDYISLIRKDVDFMRYHFTDAFAREKDGEEPERADGLAERADVIFTLMHKCPHFDDTELYANFRYDVVKGLKERLKRGHILLNGTNATLFGNGLELLKYIAGEEVKSILKQGQIRCERFADNAKLLCARSPHITMGNLYCVENNLDGDIWNYYDLGENIVCVNAINENIQQRLNGCDYDSDAMLVTDDIAMKDEVNRIGKVHGFTETDFRKRGKNSRTAVEKKIMLKGGTSWKEELREVIAEATKNATTPDKFKEYLDKCYGVKITRDGKEYSYLHPNKQKPIRGAKLGTNYTKTEVIRKLGEQNNRQKSATYHGRGSGFNGKSSGNGVVRTGKPTHGGSAGRLIIEGIVGIEREMQRLNFAAQCADRGTDAASEEREMERHRIRERSEREQRENAARLESEQSRIDGESDENIAGNEGSDNADTNRNQYSYGKGD